MSPPATTTTDNSNISLKNLRRITQVTSNITVDRWYFLPIHLFFYIIILIIICIRLTQFSSKQEQIINALNLDHN
jgi:hypothetical protein